MEDNLYDKLKSLTGKFPDKLNILEEQIDVKLQMEYFKHSSKLKKKLTDESGYKLEDFPDIYDPEHTNESIKEQLIKLASMDDPKAYRIIEEYLKNGRPELREWTLLAQQESKMLLESSLLDENQIFISTGLGGRGNMLRYFIVFIGENTEAFNEFQQNIISSEFSFALKSNQSELEKIAFDGNLATLLVLIPFEVPFQKVFLDAISECNNYGNFLKPNFLVTNVKKLTTQEIHDFIQHNELPDAKDFDNISLNPESDET